MVSSENMSVPFSVKFSLNNRCLWVSFSRFFSVMKFSLNINRCLWRSFSRFSSVKFSLNNCCLWVSFSRFSCVKFSLDNRFLWRSFSRLSSVMFRLHSSFLSLSSPRCSSLRFLRRSLSLSLLLVFSSSDKGRTRWFSDIFAAKISEMIQRKKSRCGEKVAFKNWRERASFSRLVKS